LWAVLIALGWVALSFFAGRWTEKASVPTVVPPAIEKPLPGQALESSEQEAAKSRVERAKVLRDILQKLLTGGLTVLLIVGTVSPGWCRAADAPSQPYIPQTYDELLAYYREAIALLQQYDSLYKEADASNRALLQANAELRSLVEKQQTFITTAAGRRHIGAISGVALTGGDPGVYLGVLWLP
jgi:hypothetical protein